MTPDRRPTLALVASALVGPVVAAVGTGLMVAARDRLPERLAVHWGWSGEPDRWETFTAAAVTATLMSVLLPLVIVGLGAVIHPSGRGPLAGVAAAMAVFVGGLAFGGLLSQQPGEVPRAFPPQWAIPTAVAAIALGVALGRWGRLLPPSLDEGRPPLPVDAIRLEIAPTTRLAWTGRAALPTRGVVAIGALGIAPLLVVALLGQVWVLLLALALAVLLGVTYSARVLIDSGGMRVSSVGFTWARISLERIASAEAGRVSPMREFGGWGWRIARDGRRGYVTRAGEALIVHRIGEPSVVVTMDDAEEAAAVLNTLASRIA
jgi:hypothetical protein